MYNNLRPAEMYLKQPPRGSFTILAGGATLYQCYEPKARRKKPVFTIVYPHSKLKVERRFTAFHSLSSFSFETEEKESVVKRASYRWSDLQQLKRLRLLKGIKGR